MNLTTSIGRRVYYRTMALVGLMMVITAASLRLQADTGTCGGVSTTVPFTDVMSSPFFCQIAEAFFSGLSNGTSATTYSPSDNVPREQMAAFVTRTMDQSLKRGSRRASLKQFWTPTSADGFGLTGVGSGPLLVESDGADLWVANFTSATVSRVRASDGKLLETWTGATSVFGVLAAKGLIFLTGGSKLYKIDPTLPAGAVATLTSALGVTAHGISFDGARIWTANFGGSVSIVTLNPLSVTTVTAGFTILNGILYDGANMWVTDRGTTPGNLFKLDSNGAIIQTVTMDTMPGFPVFDGTNIWVPNLGSNTVTVVRASTGAVLATLTGNGLSQPIAAAFDGERVLVTNGGGNSVSLWKAADLSPLAVVSTGAATGPFGACSDGLNFWITLEGTGKLARF
jgi:hypothetical protein